VNADVLFVAAAGLVRPGINKTIPPPNRTAIPIRTSTQWIQPALFLPMRRSYQTPATTWQRLRFPPRHRHRRRRAPNPAPTRAATAAMGRI